VVDGGEPGVDSRDEDIKQQNVLLQHSGSRRDKHNCQRHDSNLGPLTPLSDALMAKFHYTSPTGPDPAKQSPPTLSETRADAADPADFV